MNAPTPTPQPRWDPGLDGDEIAEHLVPLDLSRPPDLKRGENVRVVVTKLRKNAPDNT